MANSIGGGFAQGLESILAEQFAKAQAAQQAKEAEIALQQNQQRIANQASQFDQSLGFDRERFGEEQVNNEQRRAINAANLAMQGSEFGRSLRNDETDLNQQMFENAMRGTTMANANEQNQLDRDFTASQNAANRAHDTSLLSARMEGASATPEGPSAYTQERTQRVLNSVDELMGKVGGMTTGLGSAMAAVPGTPARDFQAELNTLKANISFNELTQMREASKTGGALGQVSERELDLLSSALGALDAGQSPENLRQQLQKVKDSISRWNQAMATQGAGLGAGVSLDAAQAGMGAPASGVRRFNPATGQVE